MAYGFEQGVSAVFVRITPPCVSFRGAERELVGIGLQLSHLPFLIFSLVICHRHSFFRYGAGGNASAHSGGVMSARKLEETDELKHAKVDKSLSKAIMQARTAKKMTIGDFNAKFGCDIVADVMAIVKSSGAAEAGKKRIRPGDVASSSASSNPLDNLSYSVTTEAEALLSDSYGSAYLYTDAITCGSIHLRCRQPFATKPVAAGASREHLPSSPRPRVASAVPSTSTTRVHLPLSTYPSQR